jgi:hypothetical protein
MARFVDVVRSTRRNRTPSSDMNGPKKKTSPTVCSPRKLWLTYHMVSRASDSLGRDAGPAVREYLGLWETGLDLPGGGGGEKAKRKGLEIPIARARTLRW